MAKKNPFDPNYAPYGTYKGDRGSPSSWRSAFEDRMGAEEARRILYGKDSPVDDYPARKLLEIGDDVILTESIVKRAYRGLAMKHHPDHGGDVDFFKRIHAAYSYLMDKLD